MAYSNYLYHHGIKGQKWGIRRFQNPDGTLTSEGKKRYGVNEKGWATTEGAKRMQDDAMKEYNDYKSKLMKRGYSDKRATKKADAWANKTLARTPHAENLIKQSGIQERFRAGRQAAARVAWEYGTEIYTGVSKDGRIFLSASANSITDRGYKIVNKMEDIMNYVNLNDIDVKKYAKS